MHSKISQFMVSHDISSPKTLKRELNGLLLASSKTGCNDLLLITDHDETRLEKDGRQVRVVPAYAWLVDR
ncbi:MAG: hypothetical protein II837_13040 [Treponema sp.]|nr:hypothetical protein [Treponema sp.]